MQWSDWSSQGHVPAIGPKSEGDGVLLKIKFQLSAEEWSILARQNQLMLTPDYTPS